jgi:hypothetical protein
LKDTYISKKNPGEGVLQRDDVIVDVKKARIVVVVEKEAWVVKRFVAVGLSRLGSYNVRGRRATVVPRSDMSENVETASFQVWEIVHMLAFS